MGLQMQLEHDRLLGSVPVRSHPARRGGGRRRFEGQTRHAVGRSPAERGSWAPGTSPEKQMGGNFALFQWVR